MLVTVAVALVASSGLANHALPPLSALHAELAASQVYPPGCVSAR
jgi:hypothetical protein